MPWKKRIGCIQYGGSTAEANERGSAKISVYYFFFSYLSCVEKKKKRKKETLPPTGFPVVRGELLSEHMLSAPRGLFSSYNVHAKHMLIYELSLTNVPVHLRSPQARREVLTRHRALRNGEKVEISELDEDAAPIFFRRAQQQPRKRTKLTFREGALSCGSGESSDSALFFCFCGIYFYIV